MDVYDPTTVFSSIDLNGRYAYKNQPAIGEWNLARFAETLIPLLHEDQEEALSLAQEALSGFAKQYHTNWLKGMRAKLGLFSEELEDESLIEKLLNMMKNHKADYTNTFRALTLEQYDDIDLFETSEFKEWFQQWKKRLIGQYESKEEAYELMKKSNPAIIPRNHRVEEALEAAVENSDYKVMENLLSVLKDPYAYSSIQEEYAKLPPPSACPYRTFCGT